MRTARPSSNGVAFIALAVAACSGSTKSTDTPTLTIKELQDPLTCQKCHAQHYTEWSGSMHAYASKDPVFRAMNARGQRETQGALGNFCVNCHAPLATRLNMTKDGTDLDSVPDAYQGVTCYFCHQVTDVTDTHNNPLVLANDVTMRGGIPNPVTNSAHHAEYSTFYNSLQKDSAKLCGPCHDIVVPAHFSGAAKDVHLEQTYSEWQASLFDTFDNPPVQGEKIPPETCTSSGCHMATDLNVPVATSTGIAGTSVSSRPERHHHEFFGVDVALTDFPDKPNQRAGVQNLLDQTLSLQVCVGSSGVVLRVENLSAGHGVPSGASLDRRLWVEMHAFDNGGREYFSRGVVPQGDDVVKIVDRDRQDPNIDAHGITILFRDVGLDKNGNEAHMFWDIASIPSRTDPSTQVPNLAGYVQTKDRDYVIGPPLTPVLTDPRYHTVERTQGHYLPAKNGVDSVPDSVSITLHMQPIGQDVLNDLVKSGNLDRTFGSDGGTSDAGSPGLPGPMPVFNLNTSADPDAGAVATFVWTRAQAVINGTPDTSAGPGAFCLQSSTYRQ